MKFVDEYRDAREVHALAAVIGEVITRPWTIMEICGGQTHAIVKFGLDKLLSKEINLVHGPGCPVCVTPVAMINQAIEISLIPGVVFCSFGDMLRVPGTDKDLFAAKAAGGDVRIVYSPLDAVNIARDNPGKQVVFFAVGFETTAPATAMAVLRADSLGLNNFLLLVSHVLVPPAIEAILGAPGNRVQGFLAAGHVCTVMGYVQYELIAAKYKVPIVVTGFEPLDLLRGVYMCIRRLEEGTATVENQYARSVQRQGNLSAQEMINEVYEPVNRKWRGIGEIPKSGLRLRSEYSRFDVQQRLGLTFREIEESGECISGLILQGLKKPFECTAFMKRCTPEHPLGATMVSSEGACAAYYLYRRNSTGNF